MLSFAETGAPPRDIGDVATLRSLADQHVVALDAGGQVRMAHPFAAHRDGTRVQASGRTWWGNCAWDGLGIVAALGLRDADLDAGGVPAPGRGGGAGDPAWVPLAGPARPRGVPRPRPAPPVVGRHRPHLSDHAALPVGRGSPGRRRGNADRAAPPP